MATKRIEAHLAIKAIDKYSGALREMRTVTGRFADGVRAKMAGLQNLRGPLKLIEDFRKQQQVVRQSGEAMEAAREKQRRLLAEIRATQNPSAQLRREFDRARASADRLEQQHRKNRQALHGLQGQLRNAGVNTGDLAGEQRRLAGALDGANASFGRQVERMKRLEQMQSRLAAARERMDRSLATAANLSFVGNASIQTGRRIIQGLRGPVQQAIEFESAMSDVKKVVDFDSPEAFRQMSDDILKLSTRIPMAAEGLAQIVAAGGQSEIPRDELLQFAEMAAKVGVAFDISAGHAGKSMAEIKTAMRLTLEETGSLFDAMNHLSNNSAATADKTLDFMNRAGASGAGFGFSDTETLAFGAAMIAAGAGADTADTSFQNMGRALTRGASATKRQTEAMKTLGLDAEQVARAMQEDAVGTTMDVIRRLGELPEYMQASVRSDLFGDEARELTKLIENVELLPRMLKLVADETDYLGSADKEFAARAEATANNIQLMRNNLNRLGVSIGEVVLPPLNDLLEKSQGIIDRFVTWTKAHPKLTKYLVMGGAAIGAMAIAGGALLTAAAGLIGTLAVLRFSLVGLGLRAAFAAGDLVGVGRAFGGLARLAPFALSGLLKPVKWGAKLIGRIPWVRLAGRLAISSLLFPFRWTSRFIPKIGWAKLAGRLALNSLVTPLKWVGKILPNFGPALARFTAFRIAATAQMARLSAAAAWHSKLIGGAFARGLGKFMLRGGAIGTGLAIGLGIKPLANGEMTPEAEAAARTQTQDDINREALAIRAEQAAVPDSPPGFLERTGIVSGPAPLSEGQKALPDLSPQLQLIEQQVRALERIKSAVADGPLPTERRLERMASRVGEVRSEIEVMEASLATLSPDQSRGAQGDVLRMQLAEKRADLRQMEADLASARARAVDLQTELQLVHGTEIAPVISTESIDAAYEKVRALASQLRALPSGGAGASPDVKPAGARAGGGPVRMGLPYLVNERTPRSEWFVPSRSGGILNVSQAQSAFRSYLASTGPRAVRRPMSSDAFASASRVRAASYAALTAAAASMAAPAAAQPAQAGKPGSGAVTVQIENFTVHVPSGVSDPDAIADLVSDRIGQRVAATMSASFSD